VSIGGERGGGRQVSAALPDKCLSLARKTAMWETGQPLGVVVGARLRVVHNTQELKLKLLNFGQDERSRGRPAWEAKEFAKRGAKDFRLAGNRCSDKLSTLRSPWLRKTDGI